MFLFSDLPIGCKSLTKETKYANDLPIRVERARETAVPRRAFGERARERPLHLTTLLQLRASELSNRCVIRVAERFCSPVGHEFSGAREHYRKDEVFFTLTHYEILEIGHFGSHD